MTKRIGIISDTHGYWDDAYVRYFSSCDEIWHAGDIGNFDVTDKLNKIAPLKAVYGNIDNNEISVCLKVEGKSDLSRKEIDKITDWVKRPQIGASGLLWIKHTNDASFKSSFD